MQLSGQLQSSHIARNLLVCSHFGGSDAVPSLRAVVSTQTSLVERLLFVIFNFEGINATSLKFTRIQKI